MSESPEELKRKVEAIYFQQIAYRVALEAEIEKMKKKVKPCDQEKPNS